MSRLANSVAMEDEFNHVTQQPKAVLGENGFLMDFKMTNTEIEKSVASSGAIYSKSILVFSYSALVAFSVSCSANEGQQGPAEGTVEAATPGESAVDNSTVENRDLTDLGNGDLANQAMSAGGSNSEAASSNPEGNSSSVDGVESAGQSGGGEGGETDTSSDEIDAASNEDTGVTPDATSDSSEESFQPCPETGPCKVLPLGDSITFGLGFDGGYRVELFRLTVSAGRDIVFTGTQSPNGPGMVNGRAFPRNHEGISGETIRQIHNRVPSPALNDVPNIILVHAGTNDMFFGANGAVTRLDSLLDELIVEAPDALIVVSSIIPLAFGADALPSFNASIPGLVAERAAGGAHIIFADQFAGFPTSELGDGVHPDRAGYSRMAGVWFDSITEFLR